MKHANVLHHASIVLVLGLGLGLSGCANDDKKTPAEQKALDKHEARVDKAVQDEDPADASQKVVKANEQLAEDLAKADGTARDGSDDVPVNPEKRFTVFDKETKDEFVKRAHATIAALDKDLGAVPSDKVAREDTIAVQERLAEARKDLSEVEHGTDKVIDDGKLGVTVAINSARRKLDDIQEDLADSE